MTTNIKAIIFDYGNVLLEWNPRHVYRHYFPDDNEGMERFFHEVDFMGWNAQQDRGRTFKEGVADLSENFRSIRISFRRIMTIGKNRSEMR